MKEHDQKTRKTQNDIECSLGTEPGSSVGKGVRRVVSRFTHVLSRIGVGRVARSVWQSPRQLVIPKKGSTFKIFKAYPVPDCAAWYSDNTCSRVASGLTSHDVEISVPITYCMRIAG